MTKYKSITLINLIHQYPNNIDVIKCKYLNLLSELTIISLMDTNIFLEKITLIHQMGCIIISYINSPDLEEFNIIASGTIIIEPKIIRGGQNVGHIEDIVVKNNFRGKGISKAILDMLKSIAREKNCYKIILDCSESLKTFYNKCEFEEKGVQMGIHFL